MKRLISSSAILLMLFALATNVIGQDVEPAAPTEGASAATVADDVWRTDFAEAQSEAQRLNRPLMVYAFADECEYCEQMEGVFRMKEIVEAVKRNVVAVRVDLTDNPDEAKTFAISGLPTILFMADGKELSRHEGVVSQQQLQQSIDATRAKVAENPSKQPRLRLSTSNNPEGWNNTVSDIPGMEGKILHGENIDFYAANLFLNVVSPSLQRSAIVELLAPIADLPGSPISLSVMSRRGGEDSNTPTVELYATRNALPEEVRAIEAVLSNQKAFKSRVTIEPELELWVIQRDWSKGPSKDQVSSEVAETLKTVKLDAEYKNDLTIASMVLFQSDSALLYTQEQAAELRAWLETCGLLISVDEVANLKVDGVPIRGILKSNESLAAAEEEPDSDPFVTRSNQWRFQVKQRSNSDNVYLTREFLLTEQWRGEETTRDSLKSSIACDVPIQDGYVGIIDAFPTNMASNIAFPPASPNRPGFNPQDQKVLIVVKRSGLGDQPQAATTPVLRLPDRVSPTNWTNMRDRPIARGFIPSSTNRGWSTPQATTPQRGFNRSREAQAAADSDDVKIFQLSSADAAATVQILNQLFGPPVLKTIAADPRTNSVIISGDRKAIEQVAAIIHKLDEAPSGKSSQSLLAQSETARGSKPSHENVPQLKSEYETREAEATRLAKEIRDHRAAGAGGKGDEAELIAKLNTAVAASFEARQKLLTEELAQMQDRLLKSQESLLQRERIQDQIVARRVDDLLNPELDWETQEYPSRVNVATNQQAEPQNAPRDTREYSPRFDVTAESARKQTNLPAEMFTRDYLITIPDRELLVEQLPEVAPGVSLIVAASSITVGGTEEQHRAIVKYLMHRDPNAILEGLWTPLTGPVTGQIVVFKGRAASFVNDRLQNLWSVTLQESNEDIVATFKPVQDTTATIKSVIAVIHGRYLDVTITEDGVSTDARWVRSSRQVRNEWITAMQQTETSPSTSETTDKTKADVGARRYQINPELDLEDIVETLNQRVPGVQAAIAPAGHPAAPAIQVNGTQEQYQAVEVVLREFDGHNILNGRWTPQRGPVTGDVVIRDGVAAEFSQGNLKSLWMVSIRDERGDTMAVFTPAQDTSDVLKTRVRGDSLLLAVSGNKEFESAEWMRSHVPVPDEWLKAIEEKRPKQAVTDDRDPQSHQRSEHPLGLTLTGDRERDSQRLAEILSDLVSMKEKKLQTLGKDHPDIKELENTIERLRDMQAFVKQFYDEKRSSADASDSQLIEARPTNSGLGELLATRAEKAQSLGEDHPDVKNLDAQIRTIGEYLSQYPRRRAGESEQEFSPPSSSQVAADGWKGPSNYTSEVQRLRRQIRASEGRAKEGNADLEKNFHYQTARSQYAALKLEYETQIKVAQANLHSAEAELKSAELDADRAAKLKEQKAISNAEVEKTATSLQKAKAEVEKAQSILRLFEESKPLIFPAEDASPMPEPEAEAVMEPTAQEAEPTQPDEDSKNTEAPPPPQATVPAAADASP